YPPASIYMGDTGSLFLGLMLAALAMIADYSDRNPLATLNPLLLLGVPCFELGFTTAVRIAHGRNPLRGSKDHPALRLRRRGWTMRKTIHTIYAVAAALGVLALWNMRLVQTRSVLLLAA